VQVIDRAVAILEALGTRDDDLSLFELAERLDLHKSTIHRLLMVLERHRLVERHPESGKYGLGLKLFELGSKAFDRLGLGERARPYLERLAAETGETAHLCTLEAGEVLYLEKVEPSRTVRVPSSVGRRNPAHCTAVGKALLAFLPPTEVDALIRDRGLKAYTRHTLTTPALLKRELRAIRDRGYAIDDEEIEEGLRCIGAPVRDHSGRVVASMSIAGPAFRLTRAKITGAARLVTKAADALSAELGYRPPKAGRGVA
jgi:IclR family KDG regulon transcriptional repressor